MPMVERNLKCPDWYVSMLLKRWKESPWVEKEVKFNQLLDKKHFFSDNAVERSTIFL